MINVYTDGSASGEFGGWCYIFEWEGIAHCGAENPTTNNRMELKAVYEALKAAPDNETVVVHTDSKLAIGWMAKRWRANQDEIAGMRRAIYDLIVHKHLIVRYVFVRGHTGVALNVACDQAARIAMLEHKAYMCSMCGTIE